MSVYEMTAAAEPPAKFDFKDWDRFYMEALRYHEAVHPDAQLINERIATLRMYMSNRVISYLSGFARIHPRYATKEGWQTWVLDVGEMLNLRKSIPRRLKNGKMEVVTKYDLLARFSPSASKRITRREFWQGLDILVSIGDITSAEQRNLFWDALPLEDRECLSKKSSFFSPGDETWTLPPWSDEVRLAEQQLNRIMDFMNVEDAVDQSRQQLTAQYLVSGVLIVVSLIMIGIACYAFSVDDEAGQTLGTILLGIFCPTLAIQVGLITWQLIGLRNAEKVQQRLNLKRSI